jgi:FKBP-type peptidyl-prolyl cis-trans isomerase FklB
VSLDNGLLYKVLDQGDGELPDEDSTVTVHYRANLVDGREFDNSYARDEPVTFPLKGVMKGFSEALTRMHEGSKWQVVIPPQLAYGEQGAGPIGPNSTLIFEMELISAG